MADSGVHATPEGHSIPPRRSPRIKSHRESAFHETESPLPKCQIEKRTEPPVGTSTNVKVVIDKDSISKENPLVAFSRKNSDGQEKELRRSSRFKSPNITPSSFHPDPQVSSPAETFKRKEKEETASERVNNHTEDAETDKRKDTENDNADRYEIEKYNKKESSKSNEDRKLCIPSVTNKTSKSVSSSSDSLQVRELKKLEDYWTRKSPVTEHSPRLRSSAKLNSNQTNDLVRQSLNCYQEVVVSMPNICEQNFFDIKTNEAQISGAALPESPVPRCISQRLKAKETNINTKQNLFESIGEEQNTKETFYDTDFKLNEKSRLLLSNVCGPYKTICQKRTSRRNQNEKSQTTSPGVETSGNKTKHTIPEGQSPGGTITTRSKSMKERKENETEVLLQDIKSKCRKSDEAETKISIQQKILPTDSANYSDAIPEIAINEFTESDSEDDEDYIPPRKKLRSEVTRDELWDGFPLTFSFKRLAPMPKLETNNCRDNLKDKQSTSKENEQINATYDFAKQTIQKNVKKQPHAEVILNATKECTALNSLPQDKSLHESQYINTKGEYSENSLSSSTNKGHTLVEQTLALEKEESICTPNNKANIALPNNTKDDYLLTDCISNSSEENKQKTTSKRRKYGISPNATLKRSARLMEKNNALASNVPDLQFTALKKLDLNKISPEKSLTPTTTMTGEQEGKKPETSCKYDYKATEAEDRTSSCTTAQHNDDNISMVKENQEDKKKDMSILEILTHDFGDQISSLSTNSAEMLSASIDSDKSSSSDSNDDIKISKIQICDSVSTHRERKEQDAAAAESVSYTLFNLLGQKSDLQTESNVKMLSDHLIQEDPGSEVPPDNSKVESITFNKTDSSPTKCEEQNMNLEPSKKKHSHNSPSCSSAYKQEDNVSVTIEKLTVPKEKLASRFTCSIIPDTNNSDNSNIKRKVPPLRIRLKPTVPNLKKKDSSKIKMEKIISNAATTANNSDCTTNETNSMASPCINRKSSKLKKSASTPTEGTTEQESTQAGTKQKVRKPVSKRRKSSPTTSTMELRINNERRQSMVDEMLANAVLDKHACVIWSSENRRHIMMSRPDSSPTEVDDILRRKWEALSDKEKIRYFQRAKNAIKDENRHSSRRRDEVQKSVEPIPGTSSDSNPSLTRFLAMNSNQQLSELKKWLHFYHEVSEEEYNKVLTSFKESLQNIKSEKEKLRESESKKNKPSLKSKKKIKAQARLFKEINDYDSQSEYRKLLFEKIFCVKDKVIQLWKEHREKQKDIVNEQFSGVIKKLIIGDTYSVKFSGNVKSGRLTEILSDIKDLESDRKLGVSGSTLHSDSFEDLLKSLKTEVDSKVPEAIGSTAQQANDHEILLKPTKEGLPQLNPESVERVLDEISSTTSSDYVTCGQLKASSSPSSLLTSWVIADLLDDQAAQEEVQKNTNNNKSQNTYTYKNREFKSILNLDDLRRKYGSKVNQRQKSGVDIGVEYTYMPRVGVEKENSAMKTVKASMPQNRFVNLSNAHFVAGSKSGIVAVQHYDNGKPVVRFARVKPSVYTAAQLRMMNQRQKLRFSPQLRLVQPTAKSPAKHISKENSNTSDESTESSKAETEKVNQPVDQEQK